MRYLALAADYDGTLAHHGKVDAPTVAALKAAPRLRPTASSRDRPSIRRFAKDIFPSCSV